MTSYIASQLAQCLRVLDYFNEVVLVLQQVAGVETERARPLPVLLHVAPHEVDAQGGQNYAHVDS